MKSFMVLSLLLITACLQNPPTLPKGAKPCRSDWDCPEDYVCWFAGVDQYASCMYKPSPNGSYKGED